MARRTGWRSCWAAVAALLLGATAASASTFQIIREFDGTNGETPEAVTLDPTSGKLYVTTEGGSVASNGGGEILELTPPAGAQHEWQARRLHEFTPPYVPNGYNPRSRVTLGPNGLLYGSTSGGGGCDGCNPAGEGTVFSLTPSGNGVGYDFTRLVLFRTGTPDEAKGETPYSSPVVASNGVLYGTATGGGRGSCPCGVVYALIPPGQVNPNWTEVVIHSFTGSDGSGPSNNLTIGSDGSLYGTTGTGGPSNLGTVFRMIPPVAGKHGWIHQVLYSFAGGQTSGANPIGDLIFDSAGNLYGACSSGGPGDDGYVFKLTRPTTEYGAWKIIYLRAFQADQAYPTAGPVMDSKGDLYGATNHNVYELTPTASGPWPETVIEPSAASWLTIDSSDIVYGVSESGGSHGDGDVFKITP